MHVALFARTALIAAALVIPAACSSGDRSTEPIVAAAPSGSSPTSGGVRVVSPDEAAAITADPPADLVVLDVRTPAEYAEGHLGDAIVLDFYEPDFADRLAQLDRDVPYVLYCRSGNRSGQTREMMAELGFTDVADVDGGILAWADAGGPIDR
ncbi:MAG: rhodanese-like domain-containing protein [Ilumatobacter sp.]|nr:rhodanese-like domain-containing protein [Ilumatobacter sp.]